MQATRKERDIVPKKTIAIAEVRKELKRIADPEVAKQAQRFFKTAPGEYGEGDKFIGIRVPVLRQLAKQYRDIPISRTKSLLRSAVHEERLLALLILVLQYETGDNAVKKAVFEFYCQQFDYVNNWDLVDSSAYKIVGDYLQDRSRKLLYRLAKSKVLWERRIAIIATLAFIHEHDFEDTMEIAELLLKDSEDLIHKAVGWMLREVGKRNRSLEEAFLKQHYHDMPRTMLRYAIEKFPEATRKRYLAGTI